MIQKFITIKNVGKIKNYSASGNCEFDKSTLIFGENATGKTTITALFHSLKNGSPELLKGRKTLGSSDAIDINIRMDDKNITFNDDDWSESISEIEIFDSKFINDNVFNGTYVDISHRRNLQIFALGEENVALSKEVISLDEEIRRLGSKSNEVETIIKRKIVGSLSIDNFIQLERDDKVEEHIAQKEKLIAELKSTSKILERQSLREIIFPILNSSKLKNLLGLSIDTVSTEAEKKVKEHLSKYFDGEGEHWIDQGVEHIKDDTCPFCEQSISGIELVQFYKQYFSQEYSEHKNNISQDIESLRQEFNLQNLSIIESHIEMNSGLYNEWKENLSSSKLLPEIDIPEIVKSFEKLEKVMASMLEEKDKNPLEKLEVSGEIKNLILDYETKCKLIEDYNKRVRSINQEIESKKSKLKSGDLPAEEYQLQMLFNQKKRYEENTEGFIKSYLDIKNEVDKKREEKDNKKEELDNKNKSLVTNYESAINKYLDKFNADFRIGDQKIAYPGGRPSLNYKLVINSCSLEIGSFDTPPDIPSFKNTLSEGDKHTLAFAFFLAKLDNDSDLANKIIIVDDPVNSFDSNRKSVTATRLRALLAKSQQIIILTHEPTFAFKLKDVFDKKLKCLRIINSGENTELKPFIPREEFRDDYLRNFYKLLGYHKTGNGDIDDVAKSIRPLLEGSLRFRFPTIFDKENLWLGTMIQIIREGDDEPEILFLRENHLDNLTEICDYSKDFHHPEIGTNPIIDQNELKGFVKRTLRFCST